MAWTSINGGSTLSGTFTDLITGASGFELLLAITPAVTSASAITIDYQHYHATDAVTTDEPTIPVAVGDPPTREGVVVKAGDVIRMRKSGGTGMVSWSGTSRTV